MPERVLQDPNTVQRDVQTGSLECRGVDADRRAAASLLQPATSRLPRKGRSSPIIGRDRDAPKRGTWIRIEMRAGATSPG
jgi:hypothetical protein